tara:strand:- start:127 stop:327 length:201 start_codon:yes stop_codon:yes gene_type:complete
MGGGRGADRTSWVQLNILPGRPKSCITSFLDIVRMHSASVCTRSYMSIGQSVALPRPSVTHIWWNE